MTFRPQAHLNITDPAAILRVSEHHCNCDSLGIIQMNNDFHVVLSAVSETERIISESMDIISITQQDYDKDMGSIQHCSYHGRGHSGGGTSARSLHLFNRFP